MYPNQDQDQSPPGADGPASDVPLRRQQHQAAADPSVSLANSTRTAAAAYAHPRPVEGQFYFDDLNEGFECDGASGVGH